MGWIKSILIVVVVLAALAAAGYGGLYWYMERHGGIVIREDGLIGHFYASKGTKHHTAVLMLGGSNGGFPYDRAAQDLAKTGYPVFALAYFRDMFGQPSGLPRHLSNIPLEYFYRAIDWMKKRPEIDPTKIVLMGESRGGELVLLLASKRPDIAGVIAYSPSDVVWAGIVPPWNKPSWTDDGKPIPYLVTMPEKSEPLLTAFKRTLDTAVPDLLQAATIQVENIHCPVLLISSQSDNLWPSSKMADAVAVRLKAHAFAYPVENVQFNDASHLLMGYGNGIVKLGFPPKYGFYFGGSKEGTRKARDAGWADAKSFLARIQAGVAQQ